MHYNVANSYLFVNGTECYKFKSKDPEIVVDPICIHPTDPRLVSR